MKRKIKKQPKLAVELNQVSKHYTLHHEKPTLIEKILSLSSSEKFTAIKNITLKIPCGEKVAIIGKNGSGKTTLLKLMCGITKENEGSVNVSGKVISLIDLEAGFHPDMNGYENIMLNAMIVGMTRAEVRSRIKQIIEFADIGEFIDAPMYTYSSGMKLRLGFSIAVHADPDILILDEMIATGDLSFQKKCFKKIDDFFRVGKTVISVSHVFQLLKASYNRFIWLHEGQIKLDGGKEVLVAYEKCWQVPDAKKRTKK